MLHAFNNDPQTPPRPGRPSYQDPNDLKLRRDAKRSRIAPVRGSRLDFNQDAQNNNKNNNNHDHKVLEDN